LGVSALPRAVSNGSKKIFDNLIPKSHPIKKIKKKKGDAPLILAAGRGDEVTVEMLVAAGAIINVTNAENETALILAVQYDFESVVKILINKKANVFLENRDGHTAKQIATQKGYRTIELLIESAGGY
jgi:ankyrin repeat protein